MFFVSLFSVDMDFKNVTGISIPSIFVSDWTAKELLNKHQYIHNFSLEINSDFLIDRIGLPVLISMV